MLRQWLLAIADDLIGFRINDHFFVFVVSAVDYLFDLTPPASLPMQVIPLYMLDIELVSSRRAMAEFYFFLNLDVLVDSFFKCPARASAVRARRPIERLIGCTGGRPALGADDGLFQLGQFCPPLFPAIVEVSLLPPLGRFKPTKNRQGDLPSNRHSHPSG
jgi:hypothetical protein